MVQAESVVDLIRAKTDKALALSVKNLQGALSKTINRIEELLITTNSRLEASIDFPEEVGEPDWGEIMAWLSTVKSELEKLLSAGERVKVYREGLKIAITGKPNAGKSSLLNLLVQKDRAIVTDIPGTTRDVIEDYILIGGIPVRIWDTAGIRETSDVLETMGLEKTRAAILEADVVIFMVDAQAGITSEDRQVWEEIRDKNKIILLNKIDCDQKKVRLEEIKTLFPNVPVVPISAKEGTGIEEFERVLLSTQTKIGAAQDDEEVMVNTRQEELLRQTLIHVDDAIAGISANNTWDGLAVDTWGAIACLEELTGRAIKDDVLDRIFSDFCIGK
jgi:tRNA modification GTPase